MSISARAARRAAPGKPAVHDKTRRELLTPEGVVLTVRLADAGERAGAFALDTMIVLGGLLLFVWLVSRAGMSGGWVLAFVAVALFVLVNFYYMFFELRWQGATPGKRLLKLQVIDRKGGPLEADAIIARNLMRQVEFWIPLAALLAPEQIVGDGPGWVVLVAVLWLLVLALMPLFNADRLRVGDLVAGTMVIFRPRAVLLPDIGETHRHAAGARQTVTYTFTREQLSVYGIYELQVLEDVLRRPEGIERIEAVSAVAIKIRTKIGWQGGTPFNAEVFLRDFYVALRAHLEKNMLMGKRVTDKYSAERGPR